jgi:ribonuclease D
LLEEIRWEDQANGDAVTRVKGARDLDPREVTALREALAWRDGIARTRDRAPFRVVQDGTLLEAALRRPTSTSQLAAMKGMNPRLAREEGKGLLDRLARVESLPETELQAYPKSPRNGRGRPAPEVEERADRLRRVRNGRAEALGLDRGTLLPNATVLEVARLTPSDRDGLQAVPGMKKWQAAVVGEDLLRALGNRGMGPTN